MAITLTPGEREMTEHLLRKHDCDTTHICLTQAGYVVSIEQVRLVRRHMVRARQVLPEPKKWDRIYAHDEWEARAGIASEELADATRALFDRAAHRLGISYDQAVNAILNGPKLDRPEHRKAA